MTDDVDKLIDILNGEGPEEAPASGQLSPLSPLSDDDLRAGAAEFIATLIFVFIGAGSVVVTGTMIGHGITPAGLIAISLAHGMAITILVAATAHISGGHINPAVTLALYLVGKVEKSRALLYVGAQLAGAVIGASLLAAIIPDAGEGNLGAHGLGIGVNAAAGLMAEIVLTFILLFAIFAVAVDPRGPKYLAPIIIGLAVFIDHLLGVTVTGASMNPARSFGPALVSGQWDHHWIYWIGPAVGAALAAFGYRFVFLDGLKDKGEGAQGD